MSGLMVFLGVAIIVRTVAAGGSPAALGIVVGLRVVAAGAGRLGATGALERHRDEDER
jgi:hypothetical protein